MERAHLPVVCLPGFMADGRVWTPLVELLSRELPVMSLPFWSAQSPADRVELAARAIADLLPPKFTLLASDLGGSVAMELLSIMPERIAGLCLIAASPLSEVPALAAAREPWIIRAQTGRVRAAIHDVYPCDTLAPGPGRSQVSDVLGDMAEWMGPEAFVAQSRMLQRRGDYQAVLRRAQVPSLVIGGAHDRTVPPKRQYFMAELMGASRIEILDDAGALPLLETPDRMRYILREWLLGG